MEDFVNAMVDQNTMETVKKFNKMYDLLLNKDEVYTAERAQKAKDTINAQQDFNERQKKVLTELADQRVEKKQGADDSKYQEAMDRVPLIENIELTLRAKKWVDNYPFTDQQKEKLNDMITKRRQEIEQEIQENVDGINKLWYPGTNDRKPKKP